jgi:RNA recognition motif-containing protein
MNQQGQEENCRCFVSYGYASKEVGNLESSFDLFPAFSQYGTIKNIDYIEGKKIAFVEFTTADSAAFAIYNLNGTFHQGRKLKVNWAKKKEDENEQRKQKESNEEGKEKEKKNYT